MRIFSDLRAYFFNAIINVITFLYEKGPWGCCGDREKYVGIVCTLFMCDYKLKSHE